MRSEGLCFHEFLMYAYSFSRPTSSNYPLPRITRTAKRGLMAKSAVWLDTSYLIRGRVIVKSPKRVLLTTLLLVGPLDSQCLPRI
jgi:hypothetical protein